MVEFVVIVAAMVLLAAGTELTGRRHGSTRWVHHAWLRHNHFRPQDPRRPEEPVAGEDRFVVPARGAPHH